MFVNITHTDIQTYIQRNRHICRHTYIHARDQHTKVDVLSDFLRHGVHVKSAKHDLLGDLALKCMEGGVQQPASIGKLGL